MTKLINADVFIKHMIGLYKSAGWDEHEIHFSLADLKSNLDGEQSVDAIPVEWMDNEIEILKGHHHDTYWLQYCVDMWREGITND